MSGSEPGSDAVSEDLYEVDALDPAHRLVDRAEMSADDLEQIGRLMRAIADLRAAERRLTDASQKYMELSQQDMRAIQYLIVAGNRGSMVTPSMLANHLEISAASTTKLLNRLERGAHITREVHPADRRAFVVRVTAETRESAMDTVGRQHAKRFHAAARLTSQQRDIVIDFFRDMTRELSLDDVPWAEGL
ncbi:MAG TPA: MarR family transcriptional regulator [Brevibacterium sp.]|nr:MarR family transcriptional regulator [Brevibacterium sp.]